MQNTCSAVQSIEPGTFAVYCGSDKYLTSITVETETQNESIGIGAGEYALRLSRVAAANACRMARRIGIRAWVVGWLNTEPLPYRDCLGKMVLPGDWVVLDGGILGDEPVQVLRLYAPGRFVYANSDGQELTYPCACVKLCAEVAA